MKHGILVLISVLILASCSKEVELVSAPISPPPEDVTLDFSSIFAELLPDSHENLSIGAKPRKACQSVHTNYSNGNDIIGAIVETAKSHSIVIVNEAHNRASHRVLTLGLAKALKEEGFNIFAAETFGAPPRQYEAYQEALFRRGYALKKDGYYTVEAVFGQAVRDILELGYRPVFYEIESSPPDMSRRERIALREETQANNLIERAIEKYPNEKILIHVGFSHGKELPDHAGNVWMAMRIKEKTGIDPLTISQTACEAGAIDQGMTRLKVLKKPSSLHTYEGYDMLVMHPPVIYENGRGTWLKSIDRKFVGVPRILRDATEWRYIAAYELPYEPLADLNDIVLNSEQPTVSDSLLLGPGQKHDLALESGHYVVASYDRELKLQSQVKLQVK